MPFIIMYDKCIYSNYYNSVCDISRNSYTLLFNLYYMQYHYIAFLFISLEDYTSSYIFSEYVLKLH